MKTEHMNCPYCCTRHRVEQMGEHGREKCAPSTNTKQASGQWLLEAWERIVEGDDDWQDMVEAVSEDLFPHQYGEVMAKEGDFTPADEDTMMRAENAAERIMLIGFIARLMFVRGITVNDIAMEMEANE